MLYVNYISKKKLEERTGGAFLGGCDYFNHVPLLELRVHKLIVTKAWAQTRLSWVAGETGWVVASIKAGKGVATAWLALLHPRTYRFYVLNPAGMKSARLFLDLVRVGKPRRRQEATCTHLAKEPIFQGAGAASPADVPTRRGTALRPGAPEWRER